jgi:hypothetical protein
MAAIGSAPNANGATIAGTTLNLQPADATNGGVVSTAAQTFAGVKTFNSNIIFGGSAAAPTFTPRSAGTKLVLNPTITSNTLDYAWGVGIGTLWGSLGGSADQFILYAPTTGPAVTSFFTITPSTAMTFNGSSITLGTSTTTTNVRGGSTDTGIISRNFINLGTGGGTAAPAAIGGSWGARSLGTRVIIQSTSNPAQADMAIGYNTNEMWMSLFTATSTSSFGWYGTATKIMTLRGDGLLTLTAAIVGTASQDVFNTVSTTVNFAGASTALTIGATTGTATIRNATVTLSNATTLNVDGASPSVVTSSTGAASVFDTNALTGNLFGAATSLTIGATTGTATIRNATVNLSNATQLQVQGTKVVGTRITGYGTPTGGDRTLSFAAITPVEQVLAQLVADLKTHGLIS